MLWGRYASRRGEARFPTLWDGRLFAMCPSIQGPSGLNLYDTSGRAGHGTLGANTGFSVTPATAWIRSQGAAALTLTDGQWVNHGTLAGASLATPFSMSCWVRNMTSSGADFSPFAKAMQADGYLGPVMLLQTATNAALAAYWGGGVRATGATIVTQRAAWTQLGICWTGSQARVIVNGVIDGSSNTTTAPSAAASSLYVGQYFAAANANRSMRGEIDDCGIWTRCLAPGEWRTLARRRGISYELRRDVVEGGSGFQSAWARRQGQIIGGGT